MGEQVREERNSKVGFLFFWYVLNFVLILLHFWLSIPLHKEYADIPRGSLLLGGPGDGFYFFFLLLIPWCLVQCVNLIVCCLKKTFVKGWIPLFAVWVVLMCVEQRFIACPAGYSCGAG